MSLRIAPSILAADLSALDRAAAAVEAGGADLLHVDVMDGHFVPNLTFGLPVVRALTRVTRLPLDVHLMVTNPDRYIGDYIGWVVCDHFNVTAEVPLGEVTDHPDPMPGADDRFKCRAMIPREAADLLIAEATRRGNSLGDYVAKVLCDRFGVPIEPRVKKKALRAWQMASEAGEQLPMTG